MTSDGNSVLVERARQKLVEHFSAMAVGGDVPPASCYRLEGYLQGLLDSSVIDPDSLQALANDALKVADFPQSDFPLGTGGLDTLGLDKGKVRLSVLMKRAPVVPSTSMDD